MCGKLLFVTVFYLNGCDAFIYKIALRKWAKQRERQMSLRLSNVNGKVDTCFYLVFANPNTTISNNSFYHIWLGILLIRSEWCCGSMFTIIYGDATIASTCCCFFFVYFDCVWYNVSFCFFRLSASLLFAFCSFMSNMNKSFTLKALIHERLSFLLSQN